jgi:hypothetical protein
MPALQLLEEHVFIMFMTNMERVNLNQMFK